MLLEINKICGLTCELSKLILPPGLSTLLFPWPWIFFSCGLFYLLSLGFSQNVISTKKLWPGADFVGPETYVIWGFSLRKKIYIPINTRFLSIWVQRTSNSCSCLLGVSGKRCENDTCVLKTRWQVICIVQAENSWGWNQDNSDIHHCHYFILFCFSQPSLRCRQETQLQMQKETYLIQR